MPSSFLSHVWLQACTGGADSHTPSPTRPAPAGISDSLRAVSESKGAESFFFLQSYNKLESHQTLNESVHWIKKNLTSRLLDYWG